MSFFWSLLGTYFSENKWAEITTPTFVGCGAFILLLATYYHCYAIKTTRNTSGLVMKFMKFSCGTATVMFIASVLDVISSASSAVHWAVIGAIFAVVNICSFLANAFTYKVKTANMRAAHAAGMSEQEHYERVILPSLNLKK